jgi:glycosyltransferase involved in cell wall biosynthesis
MPRVIYAWNYIEWGGAQIHVLALIKEARKHFDVVVVLPKGTDDQFISFLNAAEIRHEIFSGNLDLKPKSSIFSKIGRHWTRIKSEYAMLRTIKAIGLDNTVVHIDLLPCQSLLSLVWLAARVPVFVTLHNALSPSQKWRYPLWKIKFAAISLFENFNVFCANKHAAAYFRRLFAGHVNANMKITYASVNPVEIDQALASNFDRAAELSRFDIPAGKFVVLAVGQFIDRKGRWVFLETARLLQPIIAEIEFIWIAPSSANAPDKLKIDSYELGSAFRLLLSDEVGNDRISILRFFRVADIFALPSFVEGLPISLLEAMSLGIPSISTNIYGIPEALIDEQTGLLIEPGNADDLAAAILRLYRDRDLRSRLAAAGRQHVVTNFDERDAAKTAVAAYQAAIRSESGR